MPLIDLPEPGDRGVPRYSALPFPAYRYVPGVRPHPRRDPAGHSYRPARQPPLPERWQAADWSSLDDWLYGVDLFNHFYFWEAHEAWENLWSTTERESPAGRLLQGLIQIAAAFLKTHTGVHEGATKLASVGLGKLERVAQVWPHIMGLELPAFARQLQQYFYP